MMVPPTRPMPGLDLTQMLIENLVLLYKMDTLKIIDCVICKKQIEPQRTKEGEIYWTQGNDVPSATKDKWTTYRQELRDLPSGLDTAQKVRDVTWPTEPS